MVNSPIVPILTFPKAKKRSATYTSLSLMMLIEGRRVTTRDLEIVVKLFAISGNFAESQA